MGNCKYFLRSHRVLHLFHHLQLSVVFQSHLLMVLAFLGNTQPCRKIRFQSVAIPINFIRLVDGIELRKSKDYMVAHLFMYLIVAATISLQYFGTKLILRVRGSVFTKFLAFVQELTPIPTYIPHLFFGEDSLNVIAFHFEFIERHPHFIDRLIQIFSMSRLKDLKDFISRPQIKDDPFWRSVLVSDSRSLFPKHQLSKIQLSKNQMNKLRLIMEQLPQFLALPLYVKRMSKMVKNTQQKQVKKQLQNINQEFVQYKQSKHTNDYQFEVVQMKDKVEQFCHQLGKKKIASEVREVIQKNDKWNKYLQANTKQLEPVSELVKERGRCDLARVIQLEKVDDCLTVGTAGRVIQHRIKEQVLMNRLKQVFELGNADQQIPNDPFHQQWQQLLQKIAEPACFV